MKTFLTIASLISFSLLATGCGESRAEKTPKAEPVPAATFKAGHGLQLTPLARDFLGIASGAVGTHDFASEKGATAIPAQALLRTVKGDFVFVLNGDAFLRTPVTVGASSDTHVAIKEGLYEGDSIVIRGVRELWLAEIQAVNGGVGCADGH